MPRRISPLLALFLTVFLDLLAFGLVIPDIQLRGESLGARGAILGLLIATFSIAQLAFAPGMGRLSDRIGRRPVLLATTSLSALAFLAYAFADNLPLMFLARVLSGIASANIGVAYAYVADVTAAENRAKGMGVVGAAFGLGFILGPPLGSFLVSLDHARHIAAHPDLTLSAQYAAQPLVLGLSAVLLSAVNWAFVYWILPESRKGREPERNISTIATLRMGFSTKGLALLLALFFAFSFAFSNLESTYFRLSVNWFGLEQYEGALILVVVGVVSAVMQGGVVRWAAPRFGEPALVRWSYLALGPCLALIPFLKPWAPQIAVIIVTGIATGLAQPALGSLISKSSPAALQGSVFGATQALGALARILGPVAGNKLYELQPYAPYLLAGAIMAIPALGAWWVKMPGDAPDRPVAEERYPQEGSPAKGTQPE